MRLLNTFILIAICLTANGQTLKTKRAGTFRVDTLPQVLTYDPLTQIDTEIRYTDSAERGVVIQNSGPRGGRGFTDTKGIKFGYRLFWTRVINESTTPLELTVNFPADSFSLSAPDSYMKVFLPPDTLILDKKASLDYDASLKMAYEALLHTPPKFQRTINPREAFRFYFVVLRHHPGGATPRGGFALKGQELFYRIAPEFDAALIPCGRIVFKN